MFMFSRSKQKNSLPSLTRQSLPLSQRTLIQGLTQHRFRPSRHCFFLTPSISLFSFAWPHGLWFTFNSQSLAVFSSLSFIRLFYHLMFISDANPTSASDTIFHICFFISSYQICLPSRSLSSRYFESSLPSVLLLVLLLFVSTIMGKLGRSFFDFLSAFFGGGCLTPPYVGGGEDLRLSA